METPAHHRLVFWVSKMLKNAFEINNLGLIQPARCSMVVSNFHCFSAHTSSNLASKPDVGVTGYWKWLLTY
jgi:hypothetical protein